ncbi:MAG: acyl carrier protein [Ruminococcaceae bacterium]|nr:acyl carrier protein [Oscillospiraceae bacterium]
MFEELKTILSEQLKIAPEELKRETNLRSDCGVNSIELAELVLELEDKYDCEIDEKAISKLATLGEIADYLEKELN